VPGKTKHPSQALRLLGFLNIPEELINQGAETKTPVLTRERVLVFAAGGACGFMAAPLEKDLQYTRISA